ncbi:hypothetical protein C922_05685 [Plasmodium inui San Antonio 1]|uniref:Uncharacterized protein n=1 Tax=Plasmodium inui San Antonio 1 TaxID=1237626 RepID=W7AF73_9APIC|nr:hypothetical protein C922_05685 [Plasmodium inui San Antonio 1]EUD63936.1 hypothetical protein C922_05685 [Plasmodium inui San Antonio 1]
MKSHDRLNSLKHHLEVVSDDIVIVKDEDNYGDYEDSFVEYFNQRGHRFLALIIPAHGTLDSFEGLINNVKESPIENTELNRNVCVSFSRMITFQILPSRSSVLSLSHCFRLVEEIMCIFGYEFLKSINSLDNDMKDEPKGYLHY